jgi:hypothetical protein
MVVNALNGRLATSFCRPNQPQVPVQILKAIMRFQILNRENCITQNNALKRTFYIPNCSKNFPQRPACVRVCVAGSMS